MRTIGTVGEYTLIEDGMWMGTIDKEGKMHISPDMQYRSIYDFVDGIAVAFQNEKWGLIDTEGNHIFPNLIDIGLLPQGLRLYRLSKSGSCHKILFQL